MSIKEVLARFVQEYVELCRAGVLHRMERIHVRRRLRQVTDGQGRPERVFVWSKFPNALCSGQLPTPLGQVQTSRPAIIVNVKQKLKRPIGDRFGIQPISQNALLIGQREDGETGRRVVLLNGSFERVRAGIIAVCGEQDDLLTLTCLPHVTI